MNPPAPIALGRGVVVGNDDPPEEWNGARLVTVDDNVLRGPQAAVEELHEHWAHRIPVVVRMTASNDALRDPASLAGAPWRLGAGATLWRERLFFLVWANNYDGREQSLVWWWARKAARIAESVQVLGPDEQHRGDIVLPDGTPAFCDGGPRGPFGDGHDLPAGSLVIHRESIEIGRLTAASPNPGVRTGVPLAPDQEAAVTHRQGPARIVAPAGSGKTRVLTERVRHLVLDRQIEPPLITAVAYNKRAAEELVTRLDGVPVRAITLNALGYGLLRRAAERQGRGGPNVASDRDQRGLIDQLVKVRRQRNTDPTAAYIDALGEVRLALRDPEDVERQRDDVPGFAEMFDRYRGALAERNLVDFDEQIYGACEVLLRDPGLRAEAQARCRHLLVDEFQDLTPARMLLVRLLAGPSLAVFGVGDDDQVIYGYNGATPSYLIDFAEQFPGAAEIALEVNYRCPPEVVVAASNVLGYNHVRVDKQIRPAPDRVTPESVHPVTLQVPEEEALAPLVCEQVVDWVTGADAVRPGDIAILTRVNASLLPVQLLLDEADVPCDHPIARSILERTGLRAALAYIRLALSGANGPFATSDLLAVANRPSRSISRETLGGIERRRQWTGSDLASGKPASKDRQAEHLAELAMDLDELAGRAASGATTAELLRFVRDRIGIGSTLATLDGSKGGGAEGASHGDDLAALIAVAVLQPDPATFEANLRARLPERADGASDEPPPEGDSSGKVRLSSVHRVKGLEWPRVIVAGVSAGLMPHELADDLEEERRIFHVALTRAAERVVLVGARERPSRFLAEAAGTAPKTSPRIDPPALRAKESPTRDVTPAFRENDPLAGDEEGERIFEALRTWRGELARADGVPAYVILHDKHLRSVAASRPANLAELARCDGIGRTRLDRYGDDLLAVIEDTLASR